MSGWRAIPGLAWRDTRTARRRLFLSVSAISFGIAALVATDSFSADVVRSLDEQAQAFLGGDLQLSAREALGAHVGDTLFLGFSRFAITATLQNVPGDVGIATAMGPRVYIPDKYLAETRLLGFGSRAQYEATVALPAAVSPARATTRAADARAHAGPLAHGG